MDIERIIKKGSLLSLLNAFTAFNGVLTIFFLMKEMKISESGEYFILTSFALGVSKLLNLLPWQAVIQYYNPEDRKLTSVEQAFSIDIYSFLFTSSIAIVFYNITNGIGLADDLQPLYIQVFLVSIIFFRSNGFLIGVARLKDKFFAAEFSRSLSEICKLLGLFFLYFNDALTLEFALINFVIAELVLYSLLFLIFLNVCYADKAIFNIKNLGKVRMCFFKYSFSSNLNSSIVGGIKSLDEFILGMLGGSSVVSIYKFIKTVSSVIGLVTDPLQMLIFPNLVSQVKKGIIDLKKINLKKIHICLSLISLIIISASMLIFYFGFQLTLNDTYYDNYYMFLFLIFLSSVLLQANFFYLQPLCMALGFVHRLVYLNVRSSLYYIGSVILFSYVFQPLTAMCFGYFMFSASSVFGRIKMIRGSNGIQ